MGRPKLFDREKFLETTVQLFWKKGYAALGLAEILEASGVSKSSLYSEFKDKDDVFNECIKSYRANLKSVELLQAQPLGWKNVETFLQAACKAEGARGCFIANSVREYTSLPAASKFEIAQHSELIHRLIKENVAATGTVKNPSLLASAILTFSSGVALKLNAANPKQVLPEIKTFMDLIKSSV